MLIPRSVDARRYQVRGRPIAALAVDKPAVDSDLEPRAFRQPLSHQFNGAQPDTLRETISFSSTAHDSRRKLVERLRAHAVGPPQLRVGNLDADGDRKPPYLCADNQSLRYHSALTLFKQYLQHAGNLAACLEVVQQNLAFERHQRTSNARIDSQMVNDYLRAAFE